MSYAALAALAEDRDWVRRVRACLTEQLAGHPAQPAAEQLAYALAWPLATSPGFAGTTPTDGQLLSAVQALLPAALAAHGLVPATADPTGTGGMTPAQWQALVAAWPLETPPPDTPRPDDVPQDAPEPRTAGPRTATAPRTVRTAMEWAWAQHTSGSTAWPALCLSLCRQSWGLPVVHPDAITAARAVDPADRLDWLTAPPGAPVFFEGGKHGHVVLAVGDGTCLTNDATGRGKVGRVRLDWFAGAWGMRPLWAARTLNGYRLPLTPATRVLEDDVIAYDDPRTKIIARVVAGRMVPYSPDTWAQAQAAGAVLLTPSPEEWDALLLAAPLARA